jgi:hypothetical protein
LSWFTDRRLFYTPEIVKLLGSPGKAGGLPILFTDVAPIPLRVKNYTGEAVTLTCEYLNNDTGVAPLTSLTVQEAGGDEQNGLIYTTTLVFSTACTSNTAYTVGYTVSTAEMYVEIH